MKSWNGRQFILDDTDLAGSVAANPAEQIYFHVIAWDSDGATSSLNIEVVIEYESWFVEPRTLTQSLTSSVLRSLAQEEKKCR